MNELSLVLNKPVEELVPLMISWNNAELLTAVKNQLEGYKGIQYSDEQIGVAKKDKATLNSFVKALNNERIRIHKVYIAPYDKFKSEVDEVCAAVNEVICEIDKQVKDYEASCKAKKQEKVTNYFASVIGDLKEFIPYEKIHNETWLNASKSMKSIQSEIDDIVNNAKNALVAIEALHSEDEALIKAYYFRTLDLGNALLENDRLKEERSKIEKSSQPPVKEEIKPNNEVVAELAINKQPNIKSVKFEVFGTLDQLKALKQFLIQNNIKYSAIK